MQHSPITKTLAVFLALVMLLPGGTFLTSAECEHDFSVKQVVAEPTCTTDRVSHYLCSKCGEEEKDGEGNVIDYHSGKTLHDLIESGEADSDAYYTSTTAPTCTENGSIQFLCDDCDTVVKTETLEALGHNGVWEITQDATADHPGVKSFICSRCGDVLPDPENPDKISTQEFNLHEHICERAYPDDSAGTVTLKSATCTTDGERGLLCKICNAVFATEPIEAAGHFSAQLADYLTSTYDLEDYIGYQGVITVEPTCTQKGSVTFTCDICGEVMRTYDLDPTGHINLQWKDYMETIGTQVEEYIGYTNVETKMPTCTEPGVITFLCDICGEVLRSYPLDATGHHSDELDAYMISTNDPEDYIGHPGVVAVEPTCVKKGSVTFTCDACGANMRTYDLDATGHTFGYEQAITEATCATKGRMGSYCANCGELYETKEIEALGHDYGEWTPNGDKTHSRSCSRCQFTDKATCKFNATVTDPTCLNGGYTTYVCADCGYTYVNNYTDALGHNWGAWIADEGADTHTRTCDRCGVKETEDHGFGEWVYNHDAQFFKNGTKSMTCGVCGKVVTEKAKFTAWIWHLFYPILLWVGTIVHKSVFLASLSWFLPWLNIQPKM